MAAIPQNKSMAMLLDPEKLKVSGASFASSLSCELKKLIQSHSSHRKYFKPISSVFVFP